MPPVETDWAEVMDHLIEGDRLALIQVSRLISSFLRRWNAHDFRDEWDDLIQEVVLATATALSEGRIRERQAVAGYIKSTARFKFASRLRRHLRIREDDHLPWDDVMSETLELETESEPEQHGHPDLERALEKLAPARREALLAVYAEGMTYEEAAKATGIPLGTLKGHLRAGVAALNRALRAGGTRRVKRR